MTHSRSAFGASPSRGCHLWPGKAGSAVAACQRQGVPVPCSFDDIERQE
jgi:hypothetical protein